jgi:two-component system, cell cycle sensor histidine kinase and response regulator CckA
VDQREIEQGRWRPRAASVVAGRTLLARADELLASGLSGEETLERIARLPVPDIASWCAIDVIAEEGDLRRLAVAQATDEPPPLDAAMAARVARTGEGELAEHQLSVPLLGREGPVGALTFARGPSAFERADARLAAELARRATNAVDHVRLHRSLARSEERYRLLFESNPLAMWVYDIETLAFLAVNESAVRRYGYSRAEFLAMTIADIRPPDDIPDLLANIRSGPGSQIPRTWRHRRKDGTLIDVEITAGRIVFEGRDASLVLANDVSERQRLERRLGEAEKMEAIGRLAGGVAHDFNNLLTVISGYASLLLADEDRHCEELREIARAADQASALTRQLLAFSRRQVMHPQVLDLNEIIAGMRSMLHRIIGDDVTVGTQLASDLCPVEADQAQIERVILNLAANARDAMPSGGRLTIETANVELDAEYVHRHREGSPGPHVLLAVSDTGGGISPEIRARLFEPFFTTKEPGAGTGLGLATVFGVVKQSGGSIYVYSEQGTGTTFKIYLPAARADVPAAPAAPEPAVARGTETIMVVEDDESVRELVRLILEGNGYRVHAVGCPADAARVCSEVPAGIDLLLTDVVMPQLSGRKLAERLAEDNPGLRVLFMSGYSDEAVYRHGVLSPDAAFIEKPFTERSLTGKVREVLDRRSRPA